MRFSAAYQLVNLALESIEVFTDVMPHEHSLGFNSKRSFEEIKKRYHDIVFIFETSRNPCSQSLLGPWTAA